MLAALLALIAAGPAGATVKFERIAGYDAQATPDELDRVGILGVGPKRAPNVVVLNPGTVAFVIALVGLPGGKVGRAIEQPSSA